ncbi:mCG145076, partial [Mus musculus]
HHHHHQQQQLYVGPESYGTERSSRGARVGWRQFKPLKSHPEICRSRNTAASAPGLYVPVHAVQCPPPLPYQRRSSSQWPI